MVIVKKRLVINIYQNYSFWVDHDLSGYLSYVKKSERRKLDMIRNNRAFLERVCTVNGYK